MRPSVRKFAVPGNPRLPVLVTDAGSPHRHGTRIGRVTGFLAVVLRHVDVRWKNDNETTPGLWRRNSAEH
jgi:hypothetical protein